MDIQNNSIVTDADTDVLDSQITQISNDFAETYYFDNEQQEELEMLVAKCMKLGELYERKKWQAAKAQAVPEGFVLVKMDDLELLRDSTLEIKYASLSNDSDRIFSDIEDIQLSVERLIELQEPAND